MKISVLLFEMGPEMALSARKQKKMTKKCHILFFLKKDSVSTHFLMQQQPQEDITVALHKSSVIQKQRRTTQSKKNEAFESPIDGYLVKSSSKAQGEEGC